jgi:uncharacterized membrane protein
MFANPVAAPGSPPPTANQQPTELEWDLQLKPPKRVCLDSADLEILKNQSFFRCLSAREIAAQRERMDKCCYHAGEEIQLCQKGENRLHIITAGKIGFFVPNGKGEEIKLGEAGPGGFFGEYAALVASPGSMKVRALEDVSSLALEPHEFKQLIARHPEVSADIASALNHRFAAIDQILQQTVSRNSAREYEKTLTVGQKLADKVADTMGSWRFIVGQATVLGLWALWNVLPGVPHFDPYPFIFMNLALSCQAAFAAPIIMMSQNRQSEQDRIAAEIDHKVNVKAEVGIDRILKRLEALEKRQTSCR